MVTPTELTLQALYRSYGYTLFNMSKFEEYELYAQNKNFLVSSHVIAFTDTTGRLMALKPDVTLAIVKNTKDEPKARKKLYYTESVYRVSQKSGTFREIQQTGVECLGDIDSLCLAEILTMAKKSLDTISRDSILAVSSLDLVDLAVRALGAPQNREGDILDALGEKNPHAIDEILREEGLPEENSRFLKALLTHYGKPSAVLPLIAPYCESKEAKAVLDAFAATLASVDERGVVVDFSTLGDMRYYTGIVFRGYINGIAEAVLSGGEYNRLMQKMNKRSSAIGFALYLDLLDDFGKVISAYDGDALLLYTDETALDAIKAAEELRKDGLSVACERICPEDRRYRKVYTVTKGGALDETHA